jgi:dTDP-4-amino-4,6-dideoxygalactose transaminase
VPQAIAFNRVSLVGTELRYIQEAFERMQICGDGIFTKNCQQMLEQSLGVCKALLTTSCTHALEMAALLLDVKPGEEVIVPSFTFVSTINAFVLRGAKPVFIDVRPDTFNLDEEQLESLVTPATKAIVAVHYAGVGCEMDRISTIVDRYAVPVVEDNAHGLFGRYRGRFLGTFGCVATQSFHETKNFSCGEGGALLINNPKYIERAEVLREKGTDRSRFFRGQVDRYTWVDIGSSYLPSEILAAVLYAQLEVRAAIQTKRKGIWQRYWEGLRSWADENDVRLPIIPTHCEQTYHMFYLLLPNLQSRQAFIQHLKERSILSVFHYVPLHVSRMGQQLGGYPGQCPVTERISDQIVRLPLYSGLSETDQDRILQAIQEFRVPKLERKGKR